MAVYFDHNATTPVAPEVLEAMLPYFSGPYANASSLHRQGRAARDAVEAARQEVADLMGASPAMVIWTSGGTEANNLAIKGAIAAGSATSVLYGATEHPAVMECAESLRRQDVPVDVIAVDVHGRISMEALASGLTSRPAALVSIMAANNETGVIQQIPALLPMIRSCHALLHVDAVQALGKIPLSISDLGADFVSVSAHKLYGPRGIGALIRTQPVELEPLHHGGAQEGGVRGGTENVAAIVGFGAACRLAAERLHHRYQHLRVLRDRLEAGLARLPQVRVFAQQVDRLPNTVQCALSGWTGETLLMHLDRHGFCVSSGSACAAGSGAPSHVLLAMGIPEELAFGAIRISLGEQNSADEVDRFLATLAAVPVTA